MIYSLLVLFRCFVVLGLVLSVTAGSAAVAEDTPDARYSFDLARADGEALTVPDASGHGHDLWARTARGGEILVLRDGDRPRLRFPEPCDDGDCPHAILQGAPFAAELNPGSRRIKFGATLRMTADETTDGSNVLQKGYSLEGSQYKLQVDGFAGKPSCVVVGDGPIWLALSRVGVADGEWHAVECLRDGDELTISVDGARTGRVRIPEELSIYNGEPLRLGGKGTAPNNDQYCGELSAAFVSIG